ncbi:M10 family metallopeptidase [Argonema galeatum]|uniref:M10 family metallopeptidase n=1 Tax=Argonema galeatum TaxID=2942762 RepID=UPI002011486F|nr:M10 family metallopeptidase [Argonema galeatum]MCL1468211.1 M10 family metallopeptidase C-terminal domain-containing protein [Argonema galeatum A003/A1]
MFPPVVLPLNIEEIYDDSFYRASNPGLANLNDRDLLRHFLTTGVSQGLRASPFFDLSFYRNSNPELKNLDNQQLINQFLSAGVAENRRFSPLIDLDFYQQNNPDLAGLDRAQLFEHLKKSGLAEGRSFSLIIDLNSYRASNPNFAGLSNEQLFEQFQLSGGFVQSPVTQFLDVGFYREANPDLAQAGLVTDAQLLDHFQSVGLKEGRSFSPFLDLDFYRARNSDLAQLSNRQLAEQLITSGLDEGRPLSPFFDLNYYRASNSGLGELSNRALWENLQNVGVPQALPFSRFFDLNTYRNSNPDLASLNNEQLFEHFQNFGVNEGRTFSQVIDLNFYRNSNQNLSGLSNRDLFDLLVTTGLGGGGGTAVTQFFDPDFYRRNNPDLAVAGIVTDTQLLEHFQNFGLDNDGRKFSPYLDLEYYIANNPDLVVSGVDTRREAFNHFQQFGLDDGRRFSQFFDVNYYLDNNRRDNRTLREAGVTPRQAFADFQNTGLEQGLRPSLLFDPDYYRFNNPDLDLSQGTRLSNKQLFEHFQLSGLREGRRSSVFFDPDAIAALIRADVQAGSADPSQVFIPSVKWNIPANGTLSYSFVTTASAFLYEGRETGVNELTPEIKQNIRNILAQYSQIIPVNFVEVPDRPPNIGQLRFMFSNADRTGQSDPAGYAYYPSDPGNDVVPYPSRSVGGDVHLRLNPNINFADAAGNAGYEFLVQKVGQALGLSTPLAPPLNFSPDRNNNTNSVMSSNQAGRFASTPMSYDVRALQFLYGASYFNNTDTTYRIDGSNILQKRTIWDSGGVDTLDFTGLGALPLRFNNFDYYFDMNEGGHNTTQIALNVTYSIPNPNSTTAAPLPDTVFRADDYSTIVAFGSQIENLLGSGGNDEILGNNLGNDIKGGEGDDRITGARGADTLTGGGGVDTFVFAAGDGSLNREGADIIIDFQDGVDRIGLALGLRFGSLSIAPGANVNDTSIRIASSGEYLAVLTGVPSTAITSADFTFV